MSTTNIKGVYDSNDETSTVKNNTVRKEAERDRTTHTTGLYIHLPVVIFRSKKECDIH